MKTAKFKIGEKAIYFGSIVTINLQHSILNNFYYNIIDRYVKIYNVPENKLRKIAGHYPDIIKIK